MTPFIILLLLGVHEVTSVTHSLKYFYTASSGVPNFPEYVSVGLVDDVQISHCDSNSNRNVPKQEWMKHIRDDPQYWEQQTQICLGKQQTFKGSIDILKPRFNQTGGVHIYQNMYGCEWDDETGEINAFYQFGYDGEDLIAFDLKSESWIAAKQQAFITKHKWDNNKANTLGRKNYLTQICPEWLKKYVNYGQRALMRTVLPSVSLLQKTPSSPISCHATGFYPTNADLFWRKDGEQIHEGVDKGEILPNHDGTFQMSIEMDFTSVPAEEQKKYECVFQLSGVKEDQVTRLEKTKILTNENNTTTMIIIIVAVVALLLAVVAIGLFVYRKKMAKQQPSPVSSNEVLETLNPDAHA